MVGEVTEGATYLAFFDLVNDIWKKPLYTNKQLKYEAKLEFCID